MARRTAIQKLNKMIYALRRAKWATGSRFLERQMFDLANAIADDLQDVRDEILNDGKVEAVAEAWTSPGRSPSHHRTRQDKLHREWPELAQAIEELATERPL